MRVHYPGQMEVEVEEVTLNQTSFSLWRKTFGNEKKLFDNKCNY